MKDSDSGCVLPLVDLRFIDDGRVDIIKDVFTDHANFAFGWID